MLQALLCAAALYWLISKLGPEDTPVGSRRILAIVIVVMALQIGLGLIWKSPFLALAAFFLPTLVVWPSLQLWCGIKLPAAIKITAAYFGVQVVFLLVATVIYALSRHS